MIHSCNTCRMSLILISVIQIGTYLDKSSLVPRLSHLQFLITCSMQKRRGKAWSILSHEWRQRQRGGRGPQLKERILRILILRFEPGTVCSLLRKCLKLQHLGQKLQGWGTPPLHSPSRHWHHSCDKMNQAFPLCFYTTASDQKLEQWEGLEMKLIQIFTYLSPQNDLNGLVCLIKTFHYQYTLQSQCI